MIVLSLFTIIFFIWGIVGTFFSIKLAKIILLLEDDITEAIEVHEQATETLTKILTMQLFFDSQEVKMIVAEAMEDIKMAKISLQKVIKNFTARSKQNYIKYEYINNERQE